MPRINFGALAALAGIASTPVDAHHSAAANYLVDQTITISGAVSDFRFVNPHAVVRLTVEDDKGGVVVWSAEWAPTSALRRMGLKPDALKSGDKVTIVGSPARDGSHDLLTRRITFSDGRQLGGGGGGQSRAGGADGAVNATAPAAAPAN